MLQKSSCNAVSFPQRMSLSDPQGISLASRRYIGSKHKLTKWIFSIINEECGNGTFADIFAGTGAVAAAAVGWFDKIIVNDFLHSNEVIYKAFFGVETWSGDKLQNIIREYGNIPARDMEDNYFSANYGGKFFSHGSAQIIGHIREDIERRKDELNDREYNILVASLLYSTDRIANTVGHYDAYFKKGEIRDRFSMKLIRPLDIKNVSIFREDANAIVRRIVADVVYIDPPYNSRQYSRFYHVLETLTRWHKPELYGVAMKPKAENMSDYCRVSAKNKFTDLVNNLQARHIVVSYNNTYRSKSKSSQNCMSLSDIESALKRRGKTARYEKPYRCFNSGKTDFNDHREFLFVTDTQQT